MERIWRKNNHYTRMIPKIKDILLIAVLLLVAFVGWIVFNANISKDDIDEEDIKEHITVSISKMRSELIQEINNIEIEVIYTEQ